MSRDRILIVDDDADFAKSIQVMLEAGNYRVRRAASKREALEQIEQQTPDLIILDVMMDRMSDGFDLARRLKSDEKYKAIPILMLTAVGDTTGFKYSAEAGDKAWLPVDDYAEKPIAAKDLLARVGKLLAAVE